MNLRHLLWIIPLSASVGAFIMAIFAGRKDIPPMCEDCPRVEIDDPIGEKYGTNKSGGSENDK